jgi:tRNA/rRNA methyltransferase
MTENKPNLRVVLVSVRNPLNIGAAARAMSNFGFSCLRVVNPYPVAFREARSAVHASHVLDQAQEYGTVAEAIADCSLVVGTTAAGKRELNHPLCRLEYGARLIRRELAASSVAVLFGSEKFGLSNQDLSYCHWLLRIPTVEEYGSMNLGQAVAVCLYELVRGTGPGRKKPGQKKRAEALTLDTFTSLVVESLRESGYIHPQATNSTEMKIRRLVRRLDLTARDAEIWVGMLRQVLWKLRAIKSREND